ncbi:SGNH/GDSL hydrolase family protein [Duganella callida]|uniref:SGNH/GDSL hydrolase family protein n=1 Tax=Duganella callida TaxID=2561932 RepID=A0A4Y9SXE7_9BURK|nr:SGNH/GDSL hydrolase family protein [Duganella callida]TFW31094.1 SGNH/GDSL hydrolase family protein [Duganella callida]
MRILIIGGSNSLLKGGYVQGLAQSLQSYADAEIVQISVGATTSLSAIGRLHETFNGQPADFILYEYGINDAGHFAPRPGGAESWLLCFHLLLKVAARLYPSAVLVPLVLAQQQHFSAAVPNPIYDAQIRAYQELALQVVDIRAWMSALFLGRAPDWMYRDPAHYETPQATSIIGALVAQRLLALKLHGGAEPLSETAARLQSLSPFAKTEVMYVPALNLQQFTQGPVTPGHVGNRLMQLDYLRMLPGSRLDLHSEMFPLALFLKSDPHHDNFQLDLTTPEGLAIHTRVVTRHADTETLPFIYSSIPLPLLWSHSLLMHYGASQLGLSVPLDAGGAQSGFDCYAPGLPGAPERHLDLVGLLLLVQQ